MVVTYATEKAVGSAALVFSISIERRQNYPVNLIESLRD
jgi:hypothetical protein